MAAVKNYETRSDTHGTNACIGHVRTKEILHEIWKKENKILLFSPKKYSFDTEPHAHYNVL
jgi:hypothetical protein